MGLKPWEVYRCTLYELGQMRLVHKEKAQSDYDNLVRLEHLNSSLNSWAFSTHPEKMPSVEKLLHKTEKQVVTSHEEVKKLLQAAGLPCPR